VSYIPVKHGSNKWFLKLKNLAVTAMNFILGLKKVEAKLDKFVQEVGSGLEIHRKTIESIPNSVSAVESKLNKVV